MADAFSENNNKPQKNDVARAIVWKFMERVGVNGITFVISLILARLLMPEDYGTLALLNIFIQVSSTLIDGGFSSSLIQKKECSQSDYCSVFWFSFTFSFVCYLILFFLAPFISRFYNQKILVPVLRVMALTLIIRVFQCIPFVLVNKKIDFKITAKIAFVSNVTSGIIAIILAYNNFGIWTLVFQQIISVVISSLFYIIFTKWYPKFHFSLASLRSLFNFGSKMMLMVFSGAIFDNVYGIVIGKKFNSAALGIYNRGETFPKFIVNNVSGAMENVIFPTLSYYNDDNEKSLSIIRRFIKLSTYCVMPLMFGLFAVAKPMILVLLTDKWSDCIFFVRMFCIVYSLHPLRGASFSTLYAYGKSDTAMKFTLLRYAIIMLALVLSVPFGLKAMAIGFTIATGITIIFDLLPTVRLLSYKWSNLLKDIFPSVLLSFVMFLIIWPISFIAISPLLQLITQILIGIFVYVLFSYLLKNESFFYIYENIKKFINKKKEN